MMNMAFRTIVALLLLGMTAFVSAAQTINRLQGPELRLLQRMGKTSTGKRFPDEGTRRK